MAVLQLRPACAQDIELTYAITENAMRPYVEHTWGAWIESDQRKKHAANFTPETHRIIMFEDEPVGLVAIEDTPEHVWLVKLYLLEAVRSRGLGTTVLAEVLDTAARRSKPVQLRVLRVNTRAQTFYRRHGFRVVAETPERLIMQSGA